MFASAFKRSNKELLPPGPPPMWTCSFQHGENFVGSVEALSRDEIRRRIGLAPADTSHPEWEAPKELRSKLATVHEFSLEFLPPSVAPWVGDISDRLQCPRIMLRLPPSSLSGR